MDEIVSFFKDILNMDAKDTTPIGLCGFEGREKKKRIIKTKQKREMRLSELMGN